MSDHFIVSGMTMITARPRHRSPWIALAAFLVALSATSGADACTTMAEGSGACAAACGCCEAPTSGGSVPAATEVIAAHRVAPHLAEEVCGNSPTDGCACRSGPPDAPEPRPGQRTAGEKTDAGRALAVGGPVHEAASRSFSRPLWPTGGPPQKSPLYLRYSRLLI
jgi:hypothetical protein